MHPLLSRSANAFSYWPMWPKLRGQKVKPESPFIDLAFMFDLKFCAQFVGGLLQKSNDSQINHQKKYVVSIAQPENL